MPPGLIHEHQSPNVEARNQPPPQSPRSLIAFRGYLRLFERPPSRKSSYVTAHRSLRDLHARLIQKSLAMLPEGKMGVCLQLFREPLPQGLALHRWSAGDLHRLDVPCVASPLEPAFDGRAGDPEEVLDLLFWVCRALLQRASSI